MDTPRTHPPCETCPLCGGWHRGAVPLREEAAAGATRHWCGSGHSSGNGLGVAIGTAPRNSLGAPNDVLTVRTMSCVLAAAHSARLSDVWRSASRTAALARERVQRVGAEIHGRVAGVALGRWSSS